MKRTGRLLANGGGASSFLPSPPPSGYNMLPLPPLVPDQLQVSPASSGLAAATSPFRRTTGMFGWRPARHLPAQAAISTPGTRNRTPGIAASARQLCQVSKQTSPTSTGDLLNREEEQRVAAPGRYSAEERRERIDKYRSKRNQRNFQKKITYACRKTLADSRPRVKGRFARNAGDGTEADVQHAAAAAAVPQSESESSEWWPAAQHEAGIDLDEDMLAAYLGVSSISLYSPSASSTTLPHHHY